MFIWSAKMKSFIRWSTGETEFINNEKNNSDKIASRRMPDKRKKRAEEELKIVIYWFLLLRYDANQDNKVSPKPIQITVLSIMTRTIAFEKSVKLHQLDCAF